MYHHTLDPYPIPKDKSPLYVNESSLIDKTLPDYHINSEQDNNDDNVRIYVPLDLNHDAILRRLDRLIVHYEEAYYLTHACASIYKYYAPTQQNIDAIINNKMWYSAASQFNDPFDTDAYIDEDSIH